jgi:DNA-binding winged helix-turn-helix (wHTH) protein
MEQSPTITKLPLIFRYEDAKELGNHLSNHHSVVLLGIKRVGISIFLRFFTNREDVVKNYINDSKKHLFIPVNLIDLVECELAPFWTLTLKRIVDAVESSAINEEVKKDIRALFLESIQLQDLFFTIDSVRLSVKKIIDQGFLPTLFFIRFDRLGASVTPEFFANLEGLREASHQQLTFVFTSFLPFQRIFPAVSPQAVLAIAYKSIYIKPTKKEDTRTAFNIYRDRYDFKLGEGLENEFLNLVDGHFQYLQLGLIALHEPSISIKTKEELRECLVNDERIRLQSEELWENLDKEEQNIILKIVNKEEITREEKKQGIYLWNSGFVAVDRQGLKVFSPLFEYYVKERRKEESKGSGTEFSKKEMIFFEFLKNNKNTICEREKIIEDVWPEAKELGISDWAIDKLAGRVRSKLKLQNNNFELQTIKTRGYKLVEAK